MSKNSEKCSSSFPEAQVNIIIYFVSPAVKENNGGCANAMTESKLTLYFVFSDNQQLLATYTYTEMVNMVKIISAIPPGIRVNPHRTASGL